MEKLITNTLLNMNIDSVEVYPMGNRNFESWIRSLNKCIVILKVLHDTKFNTYNKEGLFYINRLK